MSLLRDPKTLRGKDCGGSAALSAAIIRRCRFARSLETFTLLFWKNNDLLFSEAAQVFNYSSTSMQIARKMRACWLVSAQRLTWVGLQVRVSTVHARRRHR